METTEHHTVNRIEFYARSEIGTNMYVTAGLGDGRIQAWPDKKSSVFEDQKIFDLKIKYLRSIADIKRGQHLVSFFDTKGEKTYQLECDSETHVERIVRELKHFKASIGDARPKKALREFPKKDNLSVWANDTQRWLDDDIFSLNEQWDEYKKDEDSVVYAKKCDSSSLKILRIVSRINATVEDMRSLLDVHAHLRQKEWQPYLVEGGEIERFSDTTNVLYFTYKSTIPFVSNRDCCYAKVRRDIPTMNGEDEGFILSYRSVDHPKCPKDNDSYRTDLRACHHIVPDKINGGVIYTFTQYSDPGGALPKFSVNKSRANMLLEEVKAIKNLFQK